MIVVHDTKLAENDPLSLHDALPIWEQARERIDRERQLLVVDLDQVDRVLRGGLVDRGDREDRRADPRDRKSTRLNSSHLGISYAVFCLKKRLSRYTV